MLPGISTEQLRSRLNRMVADGMLTRKRYREVPPRVDYELTERARELVPVLGGLARWGYEWVWGPPRAGESVDISAIFRLIPGLVDAPGLLSGTVELTISDGHHDEPLTHLVTLGPNGATVIQRPAGRADAHVRGTTEAWIRALCPVSDRGGLQSTGNRALATTLLDALALGSEHAAVDSGSESATA